MEEFEKALIPYVQKYKKLPAAFIRRVLAGLRKRPQLVENPKYKKLYTGCLDFLKWYDIKHLNFSKNEANTEEFVADLMNKRSTHYAYEMNVIEKYLNFRKKYWEGE